MFRQPLCVCTRCASHLLIVFFSFSFVLLSVLNQKSCIDTSAMFFSLPPKVDEGLFCAAQHPCDDGRRSLNENFPNDDDGSRLAVAVYRVRSDSENFVSRSAPHCFAVVIFLTSSARSITSCDAAE